MARRKILLTLMMLVSVCVSYAQSYILVEKITGVTTIEGSAGYKLMCPSGKFLVQEFLFKDRIEPNINDYRVVSLVVDNKVVERTVCTESNLKRDNVVVQKIEVKEKTVAVTFTDGTTWETTDTAWAKALPGQKVTRTLVFGETYQFFQYQSTGEVDQETYRSLTAAI